MELHTFFLFFYFLKEKRMDNFKLETEIRKMMKTINNEKWGNFSNFLKVILSNLICKNQYLGKNLEKKGEKWIEIYLKDLWK